MGRVYQSSRPIAFGDVDYARILYYPRLFHYCHQAFEDFMGHALGMTYHAFLEQEDLGFPTVHVEADYHRPLPYGSILGLDVSLERLGTKSMVVRYVGRAEPSEEPRVTARVTNVLVRMSGFESTPIPEWVRDRLSPFLAD